MKIIKYSAYVLDENFRVSGFYYVENGYWMNDCEADFDRPVQRHKIVDEHGVHHDIAPETIEQI